MPAPCPSPAVRGRVRSSPAAPSARADRDRTSHRTMGKRATRPGRAAVGTGAGRRVTRLVGSIVVLVGVTVVSAPGASAGAPVHVDHHADRHVDHRTDDHLVDDHLVDDAAEQAPDEKIPSEDADQVDRRTPAHLIPAASNPPEQSTSTTVTPDKRPRRRHEHPLLPLLRRDALILPDRLHSRPRPVLGGGVGAIGGPRGVPQFGARRQGGRGWPGRRALPVVDGLRGGGCPSDRSRCALSDRRDTAWRGSVAALDRRPGARLPAPAVRATRGTKNASRPGA